MEDKLTFTRKNVQYIYDLQELKNDAVKSQDYETASRMRACEWLLHLDFLNLYVGKIPTAFDATDVKKFHYDVIRNLMRHSFEHQFGVDFHDIADKSEILKTLSYDFFKNAKNFIKMEDEFLAFYRSFYRKY